MKSYWSALFCLLLCLSLESSAQTKVSDSIQFYNELVKLFPSAKIKEINSKDHFTQNFELILKEPLDHANPRKGYFDHYVYLSHAGVNQPTVLVTEGYNARQGTYELSKLFKANQVQVEYRFYGKSRPDSIPWKYLKNDQAVEDYHNLVSKLKTLYEGKWISTGISKGGETVLIYKSKYPNDIDVAVPYVAPLIDGVEDIRTQQHINTIGKKACREKIRLFQRNVLMKRDSMLMGIKDHASKKKMTFSVISPEEALEYAVLEFPFSFWQWGGVCEEIPNSDASSKVLFAYINKIVGIGFYNDKTYYELLPSYYQHMIELGYYGFDTGPVKDLLKSVRHPTNKRFAPKGQDLTYDPDYIKKVRDYVETKGDSILYIYGELDTWGACAPNPLAEVDALKMVLEGGSHKTRIKDFSSSDQQLVFDKLQSWLGQGIVIYPFEE